jgi:hypothetical protein
MIELPRAGGVDSILKLGLLVEKRGHLFVGNGLRHLGADFLEPLEQRAALRDSLFDVSTHVLCGIERRLLRQVPHSRTLRRPSFAEKLLLDPGHDAEQRRLPCAIGAEHADLRARQEREPNSFEHLTVRGIDLAQVLHGEDELLGQSGILCRYLNFRGFHHG